MIKFEFESLEELQHVLEATLAYQKARERVGVKTGSTMAETFVWVYENTAE